MMKNGWFGLVLALVLAPCIPAFAQAPADDIYEDGNRVVQTSIAADVVRFPIPGSEQRTARIGVSFQVSPGWHIYWKNSGESGIPTKIQWALPTGWRVGDLRWPAPLEFIERGGIVTYGYEESVLVFADLFAPAEKAAVNGPIELRAEVEWLACREVCVPGKRTITRSFELRPAGTSEASNELSLFERFGSQSPKDIGELKKRAEYRNVDITLPAGEALSRGRVSYVAVSIKGIPEKEAASKTLQLFPERNAGFEFGRPWVHESAAPGEKKSAVIFLPVKAEGPAHEAVISGVLTLAKTLFNTHEDGVFSFSFPVTVVDDGSSDHAAREAKQGPALEYRVINHDRPQEVPAVTPSFGAVGLLLALLSAFAAGLVLNLMPCVLPVLSLKVLSLLNQSGKTRRTVLRAAFFYALGIIASMLAIAAVLIGLRSSGVEASWGFLFHYPAFVFGMLLVVFVLSLSCFDLFFVTSPGAQRANRFVSNLPEGPAKQFFDGILTALLSTPCTAPFLGTALVFALTQSAVTILLVFLSIGIGLALPFTLVAVSPALSRLLPRPGEWMVSVREFLGFVLLGTVVWLLSVLQSLAPASLVPALIVLLMAAFFVWVWVRSANAVHGTARRRILRLVIAALLAVVVVFEWPDITALRGQQNTVAGPEEAEWRTYRPEDVEAELAAGRTVFIDFSADWCITCKFNEQFVLHAGSVERAFRQHNIVTVRADWTDGDPIVSSALTRFGGQGVPLYVLLAPDREPLILPVVLTPSRLTTELERASKREANPNT